MSTNTHLPLRFPHPFRHDHPPVVNVEEVMAERMTVGERTADRVAAMMGSWKFIIIQSSILAVWFMLNSVAMIRHWDPYPFILMNLVLSTQAAYAAPIIMMSQNRQAVRDRLEARNDFEVNRKAEIEIAAVLEHLAAQDRALEQVHALLARLCATHDIVAEPHLNFDAPDGAPADPKT
ncbi:DUF1003 domain-containing protein [Longimicrobium sp.]|uniref:DUF1003 domain-containing protein n=1 Tax=Longimicrobium sp. TaxID=2029185 RepID=UPI002CF82BD6|nr:DUF1003 domain-containing protein [Longimicrobium sp.]HSU17334.1 DUF1003 domain-containing protein [Longimicrobium sp.]